MRQIEYILSDSLRTLKRHLGITCILVLQCCLCLFFVGSVLNQTLDTKKSLEQYEENIGEKNYYQLHEVLDDTLYYKYMSDKNTYYNEISQFYYKLQNQSNLTYVVTFKQPIDVLGMEIPRECLYGYEDGDLEDSIYNKKGVLKYVAKCYQVSENFFDEFSLKFQEGKKFTKNDYDFADNKNVAVILGNTYKDSFRVGDSFKVQYLTETITLEVKGFLEKDAYYYDGYEYQNCNRYMIIPALNPSQTNITTFEKQKLLQEMMGIVITTENFKTTSNEINHLLEEANAPRGINGIELIDSNSKTLFTFSAMTGMVLKQYVILVIVLTVFVIGTLSVTINGFIRENHYEYGVFLLNGAKMKNLLIGISGVVSIVVFSGDILAIFFLMIFGKLTSMVLLLIQGIVIFIIILACILPMHHVKKIDVSEIIGGKE